MQEATARRLDGRAPLYTLVLSVPQHGETGQIADVVRRHRGQIEWLSGQSMSGTRNGTSRVHLRLSARRIDDIVPALEAAGFDAVRVVLTAR